MPRPKNFEKSKDFKGSIKKLISSLKEWHTLVIISIFIALISSVLSIISPNQLSKITDLITEGLKPRIQENTFYEILNDDSIPKEDKIKLTQLMKDVDPKDEKSLLRITSELPESIYNVIKPTMNMKRIKTIGIILASIYIISALLSYIEGLTMTHVSNNFAKRLRSNIINKINKLPLKYFDKHEIGDVLSRITNDVDTIAQSLNSSLASLVTNLTLLIGSVVMMFITNPIMALTAIFASLFGFVMMALILGKSQKYFILRQEKLGSINGYIEEVYSSHNVVVAYNGESNANKNFDELNEELYDCNRHSQFLSGIMQPLMGFIGNFGYVCVCVVGALLVSNGIITFGVIVAFMVYVRLFTNPLSQIAQVFSSLQSCAAAAERVFEFLEEEEEKDESWITEYLDPENVKGEIKFEHVNFGYTKEKAVIKDFNAHILPGQKIAIVGPTGAGKTTLVNLLMKFYDIESGRILIDGVETANLTRKNIHDLFIMVLQDTWLFEGTIKENIMFNQKNVSEEEIWNSCKLVGVDHYIRTLPNNLEAVVKGEDYVSQGQKQLLTIARGMIKNAPFLILDEATSNVDTRTEEVIQKAMDKLMSGRTSFIIAHRLSTIKNADLILVMNEGNIIETGNHEQLIQKNGFYAKLYNSQFEL